MHNSYLMNYDIYVVTYNIIKNYYCTRIIIIIV